MAFLEKDFQSLFTKHIKKEFPLTGAFELKLTKKDSIAFNRLEEHQETNLKKVKHGCQFYKISDQSRGQKPYDAFQICNGNAFVVVMFYVPRAPKIAYLIDIDVWCKERDENNRKSLTLDRAKEISGITLYL